MPLPLLLILAAVPARSAVVYTYPAPAADPLEYHMPLRALRERLPIDKERFQAHLQRFVDQTYLKAFRRLGDRNDFAHAHFLVDDRSGRPAAILYHTQERADVSKDYVDREARNWLQWIDSPLEAVNAFRYRYARPPRSIADEDWYRFTDRYTVVEQMLDPGSLGFTPRPVAHGAVRQFNFPAVSCARLADRRAKGDNAVSVVLPTGETVCLLLVDVSCYSSARECRPSR